ncbi:MAG: HPr family phosphocarrier protein [Gammaproteobacteria bacterium]
MKNKTIEITNKLGLHARAAAKLVQSASTFNCDVIVRYKEKEVSGKSIMGIMMLAASKGNSIEIITSGTDEDAALNAIESLIVNRFDENE